MSRIALSGNASGTGTFTIASPNSNTSRTLTLPDATGTVALTSDIVTPTIASTAEAQDGTNNTNFITPLRMREGFNASGSAPVYACRAWVNFNGEGTFSPNPSTTKIRASGNVSSVLKNGTGDYTLNFTTAIQDTNYIAVQGPSITSGSDSNRMIRFSNGMGNYPLTTTTFRFLVGSIQTSASAGDSHLVMVAIFR